MERHEYKGHTIKIEHDQDIETPESAWTLYIHGNRYFTGDETIHLDRYSAEEFAKDHRHHRVYAVYAYIHSGVILRRGDLLDLYKLKSGSDNPFTVDRNFDTALVGFAVATRESVKEWLGLKSLKALTDEAAEKDLEICLEVRTSILNGEVYGYVVEDKDGDEVDSCWGFIGDPELALNYAKEHIDVLVEDEEESA